MIEKLKILLVEPAYKCKYPPLGLMKLSTFHKNRGDEVHFIKGLNKDYKKTQWDRIYISTLFSFYWKETIDTIKYYEYSVKDPQNFFIGGPMATIMSDEIWRETGYKTINGLLNTKGKINVGGDYKIDSLVPDYDMLDTIPYKYISTDAYFCYSTRGCIRRCPFCAVPKIEPEFNNYISVKDQINKITKDYGEKKNLLLLDNNILASPCFEQIINEIKDAGFEKDAKINGKKRYVDFNQGVDLRLLTKQKMKLLSEIAIKPLRIAFDDIRLKDKYIKTIELAAEYELYNLSNYILFNFNDTPKDFYERLKINIELNERLGTKIYSFPMKYIPIKNKDRRYVGEHWNPRYLRGIQCILHITHGIVSPKRSFFEAAFGKNYSEFKKILLMPDSFIMYRESVKKDDVLKWNNILNSLSKKEKDEFLNNILKNNYAYNSGNEVINKLFGFYKKERI
jgi:radical SAM superfamily enzyme YgiQ (UPF0313 family)